MADSVEKFAGLGDRLLSSADSLEAQGLHQRIIKHLVRLQGEALNNEGTGGALRSLGALPLHASRGVADVSLAGAKAIAAPGGRGFEALNTVADSIGYRLPGGKLAKKFDIPTIPLAVAGVVAVPSLLRSNDASISGAAFSEAKALGEAPMSDSFHSFVQKRRIDREKQASLGHRAADALSLGGNALDDVIRKLLMKTKTTEMPAGGMPTGVSPAEWAKRLSKGTVSEDVRGPGGRVSRYLIEDELSIPKTLGVAGAGTVGALLADAALGVPDSPIEYKIHKALYGVGDRIQAEDVLTKGFVQSAGKGGADLIQDLLRETVNRGNDALNAIPMRHAQDAHFLNALKTDEYLSQATPEEKEMLGRAFESMKKFAPSLAADEFAAKNYLRESLMAANGPDYSTISNLARANRDINDRR